VKQVESAQGFSVGQTLRIWAEPEEVHVVGTRYGGVLVEWPWRQPDPESRNHWAAMGFPLDPDDRRWKNTAWRLMPEPADLKVGSNCYVGIPSTVVRVTTILDLEGEADYGWLPRPEWGIGLCPVDDLDDEDAGYVMYVQSHEPIEFEAIES
jgi:hypothetical protein